MDPVASVDGNAVSDVLPFRALSYFRFINHLPTVVARYILLQGSMVPRK
jgi:hypothetical protein